MKKFIFAVYFAGDYYHTSYYEVVARDLDAANELVKGHINTPYKVRHIEERPLRHWDEPNSIRYSKY